MNETTLDGFLGGKLTIEQPAKGHRSGTDAVFLAAAAAPHEGARVLDMGAGVGAAGLCLKWRRPDIFLTMVEIDAETALLARQNFARNAMEGSVVCCDVLSSLPDIVESGLEPDSFDTIITNPPFYQAGRVTVTRNDQRAMAHVGEGDFFEQWLKRAAQLLHAKGELVIIHRPEALPAMLKALERGFGGIRILPLHGRPGSPAERIILAARKGRKAPLALLPPVYLNEMNGRPSPAQEAVARHGEPLCLDVPGQTPHMPTSKKK